MRRQTKIIDDNLHKKTLQYLKTQKDVWAERRNSGNLKGIFLGEAGTPDICGLVHRGHQLPIYFGIETKCKDGKLTPAQKRFHDKAAKWGMPIAKVETLAEVKNFLEWLRT